LDVIHCLQEKKPLKHAEGKTGMTALCVIGVLPGEVRLLAPAFTPARILTGLAGEIKGF
jgi:hypothetical protein